MRLVNRLTGLLLGLALACAAGIAIIEAALGLLGRPAWLVDRSLMHRSLSELRWDHPTLVVILLAAVVVGLLLLLAQLAPRRPRALDVRDDDRHRQVSIDARGLEERLRHTAMDDSAVLGARVRARRRRARIIAAVPPGTDRAEVRGRLRQSVGESVEELRLAGRYRPAVSVRQAKERVN